MELWARSSKYLPEGLYVKATPDVILDGPLGNPYPIQDGSEWGNLPLERLTDIELDGVFHGYSSFQILAPINYTLNQMWSATKSNFLQAGHVKVFVPNQGKVNISSLGNDRTVVRYNAPFKPEFGTTQTVPPETFTLLEALSSKFGQLSGVQPISKGDIPSNVRSGRAIRLLEELESLRATDVVKKSERLIVALHKKTLAVIGKFYQVDEKRLVNILGRDKQYKIDSFKASVLSKPYDIRVLPSSNLPQTPGARIAAVAELFQIPDFKQLLPIEQWADMLDLGEPGRFYDAAKAAVQKAEWENEEYVQGRIPPEPTDVDNHLVHWKTHNALIESRAFLELSPSVQESLVLDQQTHEMLMLDLAETNPAYQQELLLLKGFPKFYTPMPVTSPSPSPQGQQQQSQPSGQSRKQPEPGKGSFFDDQSLNNELEGGNL